MNPPHFQLCGKTCFLPHTEVVVQSRSVFSHPNLGISWYLRSPRVSVAFTAGWELQDLQGMSAFLQWQSLGKVSHWGLRSHLLQRPSCEEQRTVIEPNVTQGTGGKSYFYDLYLLNEALNWNVRVLTELKETTIKLMFQCRWVVLVTSHAETNGLWTLSGARRTERRELPLPRESQPQLDLSLTQLHFLSFTGIQTQGFLCSCLQTLHHEHHCKYSY